MLTCMSLLLVEIGNFDVLHRHLRLDINNERLNSSIHCYG